MKNHYLHLLLIGHCCTICCCVSERDIFLRIFDGYDNRVRPVKYIDTTTFVGIQLKLLSLLEVNGQQEYVRMAVFFKLNWTDEYLTWNPEDFNGTRHIQAHLQQVWHPDMAIMTMSLQSEDFINNDVTFVGISHTGEVDYSFPFLLTNYCPMQNDYFPFDKQTCLIKVNSGYYTSKYVYFKHVPINNTGPRNKRTFLSCRFALGERTVQCIRIEGCRSLWEQNTEWEILPYETDAVDVVREWVAEEESYRQVRFFVTIKRRPAYYIWVIMVPTFIISVLSVAGIFSPFSNTGDREEKVTLGLTSLLTLAVILSLVTGSLPKGTTLPILGLFIMLELIVCAVSVAVSVIVSYLHEAAETRSWSVPKWLLVFCCEINNKAHNGKDNMANELQFPFRRRIIGRTLQRKENDVVDRLQHLERSIYAIHHWLDNFDEEENRKNCWIIIFSRIDLIFFICFQTINIFIFVFAIGDRVQRHMEGY